MQKTGTAGPLIVIDVVTPPSGDVVEERLHVGGRVDGHAAVPDLAERLRSSESRPIRVGMSKATLSPPPPRPRIIR